MLKHFYFILLFIGIYSYSQSKKIKVENLAINKEYAHFGLMAIAEDKILFSSFLFDKKGRIKRFQGEPILTIFMGDVSEEGAILNVIPLEIDPVYKFSYITSATISPNSEKLYIATKYSYKEIAKSDLNPDNFHIKVGEYKKGVGWTNFKVLPFCKSRYSYAHPAISKDGKTLYFTGNLRGGKETTKGGSDIFKVNILDDNTYGTPVNLGSKVNSYSREMFPYISDDNTLYFSSNRPGGFGGFDIYKSTMNTEGIFDKAVKLPEPINSNRDDFSYIINNENNSGYLSSKREGGKGDDDIYYFTID